MPAPTFSARRIQESPEKTLKAAAMTAMRTRVAPVKPSPAAAGPAITSPSTPPGASGSTTFRLCIRMASSALLAPRRATNPATLTASERRLITSQVSTRA